MKPEPRSQRRATRATPGLQQSPKLPRLLSLKEWAAARFVKPPTERTLLQMCRDGRIPAKQFGGRGEWYVEIDAELRQTGNDLVDMVTANA